MTRYTKAERERAAEVCSICADMWQRGHLRTTANITAALEYGTVVAGLADIAWMHASSGMGSPVNSSLIYLEAEALIRDGWSP